CPLWVKSGHRNSVVKCPLCAKSGHWAAQQKREISCQQRRLERATPRRYLPPNRLKFASFSYRTAIATAASTVGIDHAQSPRTERAAAATMQPSRKPTSRRKELFNRPRSTGINGC